MSPKSMSLLLREGIAIDLPYDGHISIEQYKGTLYKGTL